MAEHHQSVGLVGRLMLLCLLRLGTSICKTSKKKALNCSADILKYIQPFYEEVKLYFSVPTFLTFEVSSKNVSP